MNIVQVIIRNILKFKYTLKLIHTCISLQKNQGNNILGSITKTDEKGIKRSVELANKSDGSIVEIGTLFGHTTNLIASLKPLEKKIITVDNYSWNPFSLSKETHILFTKRTLKYVTKYCNTYIYQGDAKDFYISNKNLNVSMVFIDGDHSYKSVKEDINWAISVKSNIISGHDYNQMHPDVMRAVDEKFGTDIEVFGSVWIHQNKN